MVFAPRVNGTAMMARHAVPLDGHSEAEGHLLIVAQSPPRILLAIVRGELTSRYVAGEF